MSYRPRHARPARRRPPLLGPVVTVATTGITALCIMNAPAAGASTGYVGDRMLNAAETRMNDWYVYGATGPTTFDCSGLVYWSAGAAGERNWPRDTYDIASEIGSRFTITNHPQRGDLALWGSVYAPYHVEFVTIWNGITFGTEDPTWQGRVSWHSDAWFRPDFYLHINW